MRIAYIIAATLLSNWAAAQTPQCFYQTANTNYSHAYIGNDRSHDNVHAPKATEVFQPFVRFGRNGFILDGPALAVGTQCTTSSLTFYVGSYVDQYKQHCICTSGPGLGQGCTVIADGVGTMGTCPGNGKAMMYDNTYDVGLYCLSGACAFGRLYAHIGPIDYSALLPGIDTFSWVGGPVTLPVGTYAVGMGTNCDNGSTAGTAGVVNTELSGGSYEVTWVSGAKFSMDWAPGTSIYIGDPTYSYTISSVMDSEHLILTGYIPTRNAVPYVEGASSGSGDSGCAQGYSEGAGDYFSGGSGEGWQAANQLMSFKDFTTIIPATYNADCLLYDPFHDNSIGLPGESPRFPRSGLSAYDSGGCTYVNGSSIAPLSPGPTAPHMIDFVIW